MPKNIIPPNAKIEDLVEKLRGGGERAVQEQLEKERTAAEEQRKAIDEGKKDFSVRGSAERREQLAEALRGNRTKERE